MNESVCVCDMLSNQPTGTDHDRALPEGVGDVPDKASAVQGLDDYGRYAAMW